MKEYASDLSDFADLLVSAAQSKKLPSAIVEKDYYHTRALRALSEKHQGQFVLKGGTSLSKGWQILERLSEDLDLLTVAEGGWGKGRRDRRLKEIEQTIAQTKGFSYAESVREATTGKHRTVIFSYSSRASDLTRLSRTVKLEMGYRGDASARITKMVSSFVAEFATLRKQADLANDLNPFELEVQNLTRTFVEKLFAIHSAYAENHARGKTRHYYDLYVICQHPEIREFAATKNCRNCIAEVRQFCRDEFENQTLPDSDLFSASTAFHPPSASDMQSLETNYAAEADLFFVQQPPLKDVLGTIYGLLSEAGI